MRLIYRLSLLSLTAALALSLGVQAADIIVDPEGGIPAQQTADTASPVTTPAPDVQNDSETEADTPANDPEALKTDAPVTVAVTSSPPVKKLSVTRDAIKLDGVAVKPAGYNINDENYFKLRDIAYILNGKKDSFSIGYDAKTNSITLTTGAGYTPDGSEMKAASAKPVIKASTAKVLLDGKAISMTSYNIDGNNYFKLRDIGNQVGFGVGYVDKTVTLTSGPAVTYTVAFNMNGQGTQVAEQAVGENYKATKPTDPTASGYAFGGWYKDSACKTAWDFGSDTVSADTTLYAKWTKTYTVSFQMNSKGSQVSPKTGVVSGTKISAPPTPTTSGYVFNGWYKDSALKTAWDFSNDTVTADTTLYAKWSLTFTMTFHMNGHGSQVSQQTGIVDGSFAKEPTKPTADGYVFGGWYIDKSCNTPWVFGVDKVTENVTVYARWTDKATGGIVSGDDQDDTNTTPPAPSGPDNSSAIDGVLTILLDPGHGGTDPGAGGNGMYENGLNLEVAQYLQKMLEDAGVTVIMSRNDTTTTLYGTDRKNYILNQCSKGNIDLVLSIHHNSFNGKSSGAEVLIQSSTQNPSGTSKELAKLILSEYQKIGQSSRGTANGSGKYMLSAPATYGVTSVLSEFCFLDNAADAAKIDSAEERQAEAQAIFNAVMKFYETNKY